LGNLIFSFAFGGSLIIIGFFAKYMISRMAKVESADKKDSRKEVI